MTTNEFDTHDDKYTIKSYGNGWAYEVVDIGTGESLWFQDHDAEQLQAQTNNFEDTCAIGQYFECLEG
jgi:hypothetical protein